MEKIDFIHTETTPKSCRRTPQKLDELRRRHGITVEEAAQRMRACATIRRR